MIAEPNVHQAVPFFWVQDIKASTRFYVDGLGFCMTKQWEPEGKLHWCWLELGTAALMLQEFWREGPDRNVTDGKVGLGVSVCFQCLDALKLYRAFRSREIETKRPFVGNNMWVVSVTDPDGYELSFESPTDVPEDTKYAEADV
jgi:predicted lactoylglutathione lyase